MVLDSVEKTHLLKKIVLLIVLNVVICLGWYGAHNSITEYGGYTVFKPGNIF